MYEGQMIGLINSSGMYYTHSLYWISFMMKSASKSFFWIMQFDKQSTGYADTDITVGVHKLLS